MIRSVLGAIFLTVPAAMVAFAAPEDVVLLEPSPEPEQMVLNTVPENGWLLQQFDTLVEIRFPGLDRDIKLSSDLATRLRNSVAEFSTERSEAATLLRLTLACDCRVVVSANDGKAVAIEIIGPARLAANDPAVPAPLVAPRPVPKSDKLDTPNEPKTLDVEQARQKLMEQLLKAADAGIVELDRPDEPAPTEQADDHKDEPTKIAVVDMPLDLAITSDIRGIAPVQTMPVAKEELKQTCVAKSLLQFDGLRTAVGFADEVSRLRRNLVGEFDQPNQEAAVRLAKLYLSVGAREEAELVTRTQVADTDASAALMDVSKLLSGTPVDDASAVFLPDCGEIHALWRALAFALKGEAKATLDAEGNSGRQLEHLPISMREQIAAQLGLSAASEGAWDDARRFEAMAVRSASPAQGPSATSLRLTAELAIWRDDHKAAAEFLKQARDRGDQSGAEALVRLGELALASGKLADLDTAWLRKDLGTLALQERGSALGQQAFELEVKLLDRSVSRESAIALLNYGVDRGLYDEAAHAPLLVQLAEGASFAELTKPLGLSYLNDPESYAAALKQDGFRQALVRSLADEGLPGAGAKILGANPANDDVLLALARAQLDSGDASSAMRSLENAAGSDEASVLRARALSMMGELERAAELAGRVDPAALPKADQMELLRLGMDAALAAGKLEAAFALAEQIVNLGGMTEDAERAGMIALDLGRTSVPDSVTLVLAAQAPKKLQRLEGLFAGPDVSAASDAKAVEDLLKELDEEISLIQDLVKDG